MIVSIFMGAPPVILRNAYAEPFFAYFSFKGMNACHHQNYLIASLYFALATVFRSNGTILTGFILYDLLVRPVLRALVLNLGGRFDLNWLPTTTTVLRAIRRTRFRSIIYAFILSVTAIAPFIAQQYMAYLTFCVGFDPASPNALYPRPWCSARLPSVYSFVQSHYWDVGLWRYWTLAQIPNFLLAAPMLILVGGSSIMFFWTVYCSWRCVVTNTRTTPTAAPGNLSLSPSMVLMVLPYALHALALSLLLFTTAHVQIALRVLPAATPWAAWAGAALVMKGAREASPERSEITRETQSRRTHEGNSPMGVGAKTPDSWWTFTSHVWIGWSVIWMFVGSVLWLAFLPPA
ncbi:ER membrane glycoprotein subunit of the GPI transamidase complex-like protein [Ceratobasidium sp. 394]|nr:ER membrane glycoprotein subunit of the GPI transamidase complex-like protein [Ceratobasidium sp. 394]KAG9101304.1 ER membrane glycoprotein subunit of the GPI transamidase complex-like protein [Ceratobasidium sp. UAMH 11750]